ncbi:MAG: DUF2283 domain-containing protein [Cytophagales bacterium]|nr:DUF2283 domain-containing protein [Cytophagales bacterium]
MRIHYSQQADALYIRLKELAIKNTDAITDDIIADYDVDGNIIGIEVLAASKNAEIKQLIIQAFDKVMVENKPVS